MIAARVEKDQARLFALVGWRLSVEACEEGACITITADTWRASFTSTSEWRGVRTACRRARKVFATQMSEGREVAA